MNKPTMMASLAAVAAVLACAPAFGQSTKSAGFYIAGEAGYVSPGNDKQTLDNLVTTAGGSGYSSSLSSAAIGKLIGGYHFTPNVAVELAYFATGNENYSASGGNLSTTFDANASFSGASLSIVGIVPLSQSISGVGKIGVASTKEKLDFAAVGVTSGSTSATRTALTADLGLRWDVPSNFFVTLDVARFQIGDSHSYSWATTFSGGVGYAF